MQQAGPSVQVQRVAEQRHAQRAPLAALLHHLGQRLCAGFVRRKDLGLPPPLLRPLHCAQNGDAGALQVVEAVIQELERMGAWTRRAGFQPAVVVVNALRDAGDMESP
eukprot:scaffold285_cov304-Pinguiococcus_pyrenoidosus.AAC.6